MTLSHGKNHDDELAEQPLNYRGPVVVDLGFDDFIRQNWSSLIGGDDVRFQFAVPSRLSTITVNASAHRCETATEATPIGLLSR